MKKNYLLLLLACTLLNKSYAANPNLPNTLHHKTTVSASTLSLPLDFESATLNYAFTDFNGGAVTIVNNPFATADNSSSKVGKMVKNADQTWGGSFISLAAPIDFTGMNTVKMKVYSPRIGAKVLLKVENLTDGAVSYEKEVATTKANAWEELSFDYSALDVSKAYQKVVLIFDNGTMGDGSANFTFYFDDIRLANTAVTPPVGGTTQINLPVTFDDAAVNYTVIDFGNNQTVDATDPVLVTNKVKMTTKAAGAETWAGTTISTSKGFSAAVPLTSIATKMSVKVYSPAAGIHVRLKLEDHTNNTKSVETEALTTIANAWETLVFDFANQAIGTAPLNLTYNYDMASIFFNFGNTGSGKVFYWDDVQMYQAPVVVGGVALPLDFESATLNYASTDFNGGAVTVVNNPFINADNSSTKVGKMVKNADQTWGGSFISLAAPIDFTGMNTVKMKVYSPRVGAKVLLKVENLTDGAVSYEKEVATTKANAWEELSFDYSALDVSKAYQKVVLIFDNGTMGDGSANFTFYFDDIRLANTGVIPPVGGTTQINLPVTFDDAKVNYTVIDFGNNQTVDATDPSLATNKVKMTTKTAGAETWAGTTISTSKGFSAAVPLTSISTKMSVRVYAPAAGIHVRLKIEDHTNNTKSVETEALTTVANAWETLVFDFANQAAGTAALNLTYNYDMASIFFDFGNTGSGKVFYWDDVQMVNPLPVSLAGFTATKTENATLLSWKTYTETNNKGFAIQRSNNNSNWQTLGFVAAASSALAERTYRFTDNQPNEGINYYRLQQVDNNGRFSYSNTITTIFGNQQPLVFSFYPNPAKNNIRIIVPATSYSTASVSLVSATALVIKTLQVGKQTSPTTSLLQLTNVPKGTYLLVLQDGNVTKTSKLIIE